MASVMNQITRNRPGWAICRNGHIWYEAIFERFAIEALEHYAKEHPNSRWTLHQLTLGPIVRRPEAKL